jgi:heptose I phosphotransferase
MTKDQAVQLYLAKPFDELWRAGDPFERVRALRGAVLRNLNGRRTLRFDINGAAYYVKIHQGIGWGEIIKNLAQLKRPVLSARNEWEALRLLRQIGVETMTPVAFGLRGRNPARAQSFIITEELAQTKSLETLCATWRSQPPSLALRKALIERIATMVRQMHQAGMNHRDCYLCHFHLHVPPGREYPTPDNLHLFVIDLHRAQVRHRLPRRWRIKDLAGLYFSAMNVGLTRTDCCRFIQAYEQASWSEIGRHRARFWRRVIKTATRLYRKHFGTAPARVHAIP